MKVTNKAVESRARIARLDWRHIFVLHHEQFTTMIIALLKTRAK